MGDPIRPQFAGLSDEPEMQDGDLESATAASIDPTVDAGTDEIHGKANDVMQKSALRVNLEQKLAGIASIEDVPNVPESELLNGKEVFVIKVQDKEKWRSDENFKNLIPAFARLLYDVFDERDRDQEIAFPIDDPEFVENLLECYFRDVDISQAETIYVIADGDEVIGFSMEKDIQMDGIQSAKTILLYCIDKPHRNKKYGYLLSQISFLNSDADITVSLTHTPAVAKNLLTAGNPNDFQSYYCGYRDGDKTIPLSDKERELLARVQSAIDAQNILYDLQDLQAGVPEGYVCYGTDSIPPRKMEELHLREGDPLRATFHELVEWQQKNRPGECIYGTLVNLNKRLL